MSHSIKDLQKMSDEDLILEHDRKAKNTSVGTGYYVEELDRRSRNRNEQAIYKLSTETMNLARRTYAQSWISVCASVLALAMSAFVLFFK